MENMTITENDALANEFANIILEYGGVYNFIKFVTHKKVPCHFKSDKKTFLKMTRKLMYKIIAS